VPIGWATVGEITAPMVADQLHEGRPGGLQMIGCDEISYRPPPALPDYCVSRERHMEPSALARLRRSSFAPSVKTSRGGR
jgi:hypothetical protein